MQSQHLLIEERCTSCGGIFDLSFDLDVKGNECDDLNEVIRRVERNRNSLLRHLCWDCRQIK
jgi:hypothetical protein